MGRHARRLKLWPGGKKLKSGYQEIAERLREISESLARAVGPAAGFYAELAPDGRELTPSEAAAVREHLEAATVCLRSIQSDHDIIEAAAEEGRRLGRDADLGPTISVLRMMQRGFGLALSDDPSRRASAMPVPELRPFMIPVHEFWREL